MTDPTRPRAGLDPIVREATEATPIDLDAWAVPYLTLIARAEGILPSRDREAA